MFKKENAINVIDEDQLQKPFPRFLSPIGTTTTKYYNNNANNTFNSSEQKPTRDVERKNIGHIKPFAKAKGLDSLQGKESNSNTDDNIYLKVPFNEKDDAKKLGARWNPELKKWYCRSSDNVSLFNKWR